MPASSVLLQGDETTTGCRNTKPKEDDYYCSYYVALVGCFTAPHQADPFFDGATGVPHDASQVGAGILALGVQTTTPAGKLSLLSPHKPPVVVDASVVPNPSYLTVIIPPPSSAASSPQQQQQQHPRLCVVSEVEDGDTGQGKFFTFDIIGMADDDGATPVLRQVGEGLPTGGSYPCHLSSVAVTSMTTKSTRTASASTTAHHGGHLVFVSNYGGNSSGAALTAYRVGTESGITTLGTYLPTNQQGSNRASGDRQTAPHVHCSCPMMIAHQNDYDSDADADDAAVVQQSSSTPQPQVVDILTTDLGSDALVRLRVTDNGNGDDRNSSSSSIVQVDRLALPLGSGPRSVVWNPQYFGQFSSSKVGVVSLEMSAQIQLFRCRPHDDALECWGPPLSILPDDWPPDDDSNDGCVKDFNRGRWASDVVWSRNGRFVFCAARLHNSIAVFRLVGDDQTETDQMRLEFVRRVPTRGMTPRCLTLSPEGELLLVAHQHSHDVTSFCVDESNGSLTFADRIDVPLAACVKLVAPESLRC